MPVPNSYNASAEPAQDGYTPIPTAVYKSIINEAEIKDSKAGHQMVVLGYEIVSGKYAGTKSRYNYLSIGNPDNEKATKAMGRYNALFDAVKMERTGDTDHLLNKPFNCTWKGKMGEPNEAGDSYPEYMHFPTEKEVSPEAPAQQGVIANPAISEGDIPF